jgi:cytochrome b561
MQTSARYTRTAVALHWVLALALVATFLLGVYMHELPATPRRTELYNWHKTAGACILALSLLRLLWRLAHRPPPDLQMAPWQARAARGVHGLMYLLFFGVPLSGWAYSSASGHAVVVFGLWTLPDFVSADKALAEAAKGVHQWLGSVLAILAIGHVGAALKHHFVDHDGLLARMAWRQSSGRAR